MSTRANIAVKDDYETLWFYRHSDGYPVGAMPTLQKFMDWMRRGLIRNNAGQSAGWLILLGAQEYDDVYHYDGKLTREKKKDLFTPSTVDSCSGWKCGAYEPTSGIHGDIDYLYVVNTKKQTIACYDKFGVDKLWDDTDKFKLENLPEPLFVDSAENQWKKE